MTQRRWQFPVQVVSIRECCPVCSDGRVILDVPGLPRLVECACPHCTDPAAFLRWLAVASHLGGVA